MSTHAESYTCAEERNKMTPVDYYLTDERWITVLQGRKVEKVSLRTLLYESHQIDDVWADTQHGRWSLRRFLTAVNGRVLMYRRARDPWESIWQDAWDAGQLAREDVDAYLDAYRERLNLFGQTPFYQVCDIVQSQPDKTKSVQGAMISRTSNNQNLFTSAEEGAALDLDEAPGFLILVQAFSASAPVNMALTPSQKVEFDRKEVEKAAAKARAKKEGRQEAAEKNGAANPGASWGIQTTNVTPVGRNLFQTMLLNLPLVPDDLKDRARDLPAWESPATADPTVRDKDGVKVYGPFRPMTLQSRRLRLLVDGDQKIRQLVYGPGDKAKSSDKKAEFDPGLHDYDPNATWVLETTRNKRGVSSSRRILARPAPSAWRGIGCVLPRLRPSAPDPGKSSRYEELPVVVREFISRRAARLIDPGSVRSWEISGFFKGDQQWGKVAREAADYLVIPPILISDPEDDLVKALLSVISDTERLVNGIATMFDRGVVKDKKKLLEASGNGKQFAADCYHAIDGTMRQVIEAFDQHGTAEEAGLDARTKIQAELRIQLGIYRSNLDPQRWATAYPVTRIAMARIAKLTTHKE